MAKIVPKIGVFFNDPGGLLSGSLDLEALTAKTGKVKGVKHVTVVADEAPEAVIEQAAELVRADTVDRMLWVGAFAPAFRTAAVNALADVGLNAHLHHWLDPVDQGLVQPDIDAAVRQKKALTLVKMAVARTKALAALDAPELPANERVVVVGGGITGLHTAAALITAGKPVTLVEQAAGVGGKVAQLARFYPLMCDPRCGLEHVLFDLLGAEAFDLRTLTKVERLEGSPGNFELTLRRAPRYVTDACDGCGRCQTVCPVILDDTVPQPVCTLPDEVLEALRTPPAEADSEENDAVDGDAASETSEETADATGIQPDDDIPPVDRPPFSRRHAIHPAAPMPQPVAFVVERERCPPDCRACADICPHNALVLDQAETVDTVTAGAIVAATGWDLYALQRLPEYGFGVHPNVISSLEMEHLLAVEDPFSERLEGVSPGAVKTVGFIQCAGSRDEKHLDYCSGVCCSATLKQIAELRRLNPEITCVVYYMHIRTPGFDEGLYRDVRDGGQVVFIHERPARVERDADSGRIVIESLDEVLGRRVRSEMDLLVLAGGMVPSRDGAEAGEVLRLPTNAHGFFEAHRQCYPAESQRTGIFAAGCAREPMNVTQSVESGVAAAMRAMPFLEGTLQVPATYPEVNAKKCDSCGRCVEECPFQVLTYDDKEIPVPDLARCRQCGNCMGICPKIAVNLRGSTIKQYAGQIELLSENAFLPKKEPVICAFLCENDAWLAHCAAQRKGLVPPGVVALHVPCAGAVNNALIADALSYGIDGVYIGACPDGTCHYVRGNELIRKRRDDLADKLTSMSIEPERVVFEALGPRDVTRYAESLETCIAALKQIGPNPFKM